MTKYSHLSPYLLADISSATCMTLEDIYNTLSDLKLITVRSHFPAPKPLPGQSIKYPKGRKNGVARRHLVRTQTSQSNGGGGGGEPAPFVPPVTYDIRWNRDEVWQWLERWEQKGHLRIRPERLKWSPFLMARVKKTDGFEGMSLEEGGPGGGGLGQGLGLGLETPVTEGEASTSAMMLDHQQPERDSASVGERDDRAAQSEQEQEEEEQEIRSVRGRKRGSGSRSPAKARRLTRAPSNKTIRSSGRLANGSATNTPVRRLRSQRTENTPTSLPLTPSGRANGSSPRKNSALSARRTVTRPRPRKNSSRSPRKSATAKPAPRRRRKVDSDPEYSEEDEEEDEDASEESEEANPPDSDEDGEDDDDADDAESEEEMPVATPRSRRVKGRTSVKEKSVVDDDAVFAAKLAAQDGPRLLRSRSTTGPGSGSTTEPILKRSVSAVSANSRIVGRKRRRIESSPEPEGETEGEAGPDENSQQLLPNGTTKDVDAPSLRDASPSISIPPPSTLPQDADHAMEDAKSEFDSGTPFTATAHSRQSAPSDDTVIGNGDGVHANGMINGKAMDVGDMDVDPAVPIPMHNMLNANDYQRGQAEEMGDAKIKTMANSVQAQGPNSASPIPGLSLQYHYEEGSDADAEGEPDDEL